MTRYNLVRLILALFFLCPLAKARAEGQSVQFILDPIVRTPTPGVAYPTEQLMPLLKPLTGTPTVGFTMQPDPAVSGSAVPPWLTISTTSPASVKAPAWVANGPVAPAPAGTTYSFLLSAADGDGAGVTHVQMKVTSTPVWPIKSINLGSVQENGTLTINALTSSGVTDPLGQPLTFTFDPTPTVDPSFKFSITSAGIITANPGWTATHVNVGVLSGFNIKAQTASGGTSEIPATITVTKLFEGPSWTANPVNLPNATDDGTLYSQPLSTYITEPETSAVLTYTIVSGKPADNWLSLSSSGVLSGSAGCLNHDAGPVKLTVQVSATDPNNPSMPAITAQTVVQFTVTHVTGTPVWASSLVKLPDAKIGASVLDQLAATDPSCEALTYKLVPNSGPGWAAVSSLGILTGTPAFSNLGVNTWQVQATNSANTATTTVQITVDKTPSTWLKNPIVLPAGTEAVAYTAGSLTPYIVNPDGGPITCSLATTPAAPAWVTVTPGCQVTGTPKVTDIGAGSFQVQLSDGTNTATTTVQITVNANHPPVCSQIPVNLTPDAAERSNYTNSVSSFVTDPYPPFVSTLQIKKVSGPSWIQVGTNGAITGTPHRADVGPNSFVVSVTNSIPQSVNCTVNVTVDKVPQPPVWTPNTYAFTAQAGVAFTGVIGTGLSDPNSEPLTCAKSATAPGWVTVNPTTCALSGTPAAIDVTQSPETFTVTATNTDSLSATATVTITVVYVPPSWTMNPIHLPDATSTLPYKTSVLQYVSNPSQAPITCSAVPGSGPAWLIVNSDCSLSGTPAATDITSKYTVTLVVSDGKDTPAQTQAYGAVLQNWVPPVINQTNLNFTIKENTTTNVDLTQPQYITNSNPGDSLACTLTSPQPAWLTLSTKCQLTMSPLHANIGTYALNFTVTNTHALSATGVLNVTVVIDPQPPICQQPIAFTGKATVPFSATIGNLCHDSDNLSLTYAATSGFPSWLTLDVAGNLSGTPQEKDVAVYTLGVTVSNGTKSTLITVTVTIVTSIVPPICTAITLPNATVATPYMQSIASFCSDPLGGTLTYTKVSGPTWAFISTGGGVIGTPAATDVGTGAYQVTVANAKGSVTVSFTITVVPVPPIKWTQDPIPLGKQPVGQLFTFNLVPFIVNPAPGTTVKCAKISGPNWLYLSNTCQLSGTPAATDLGGYTAVFTADNGSGPVSVGAFGQVVNGPTINVSALTFTMNEYDTLVVNLNDPKYVTGTGPLTFALTAASWVNVTSAGGMTAKPLDPQVGTSPNVFQLTVTDANGIPATAPLTIIVLKHLKPPVCAQNSVQFTAPVNQPFNQSIASYATDPQGLPLTFTLTWMPDNNWLTVSAQGTLTGTPKPINLGDNMFWITATNDPATAGSGCQITVHINVTNPVDDTVVVDSPVPGASVENLWVLDSACSCGHKNKFIQSFALSMHAYFDVLDAAHIQHSGIYISSNPTDSSGTPALTGEPIKGADGSTLLTWNESNVVADFQDRIMGTQACKCNSSPIWSMFLFYNQVLKGLPEYQHSYFMPHVPAEVLIVSSHDDYFSTYSAGTPQASWGASQFATSYIQANTAGQKTLVINAMAPKCLSRSSSSEDSPDPGQLQNMDESHWLTLTESTDPQGTYWREPGCNPDMTADLTTYANNVKFMAYVQAHNAIQLSKTPADPTQIQVSVGGIPLTATQWSYDSGKNQVDIFWNLIDMSTVKPGALIEIKYQASN